MTAFIPMAVPDLARSITIKEGRTNAINIEVGEDNDLVLNFAVVDEAGAAVDISGYDGTLTFGVYPVDSGTADFTGTPTLTGGGTGGLFAVTITDLNLADLEGRRRIEVQFDTIAATSAWTPVRGFLNVIPTYI